MGSKKSSHTQCEWRCYPSSSISVSIGSIPKIFGVGLVQHWKEIFFGSEISADPQKPPWGQKFLPRRALFGIKNFVDFHIKKPSEPKTG